ncbi:MAG: hypothetical protein ACK4OE_14765 [Acidovorax sp.]|uniref:hypothetical protein n=1 Tax=Acidovorax sp. TaxID=1872122 RepID=UPI00391C3A49
MTEESTKLIQQLIARRWEYLPKVESPEQRTGALGIVNLFALASHMLTAMSGTLAIVSVDGDGAEGEWSDTGLCDQVQRLVDLAVQTSASLTRLIGMAMVALQSEKIATQSVIERESIQEIMAMCYAYRQSLSAVSLETTNMARWRGVWGRDGHVPRSPQSSQQPDPERDRARESVRALIAQIIDLGLRAELFGGTWSMG